MCTYRGQSYPVYESMKSVHVGADDKYCHLAITFFFFVFFLGGEMKILFGQMWTIRGRTSTDRFFFFACKFALGNASFTNRLAQLLLGLCFHTILQ